ncbi:hypothetical protein AB4Y36_39550 [Paraburkholderia sp. BR10936]|uniref:hypothetical protein n=1 Tax=Paraburkholderia sp. BR10936 TaxID=3236993 RepID=UPI0034D31410
MNQPNAGRGRTTRQRTSRTLVKLRHRKKIQFDHMRGTVDIKIRPTKLAFLVDPNSASQVREAIRLASSLWGGVYFPIIPLFKRMPASWRERPLSLPASSDVVRGYLDAFDPDILVQFSGSLPAYITDTRLPIIKPEEMWGRAQALGEPTYGIGTFTLLDAIYKECFKYKSKYPTKVVVPVIPNKLGLFWAGVYGEYGDGILSAITSHYGEPLDIERPPVTAESFPELTGQDVLFPRRITAWGLLNQGRLNYGRHACIFFMDANSVEDVVDLWNLRATGRNVLPLPKQFLQEESFRRVVIEFLVEERRQWPHDPKHFDVASFIRSRHSTMDEMQEYAKTLEFPTANSSPAKGSYCSLQHWYPRIWDEWARGKDGGVVDVYAEGEHSIDIASLSDLEMRIKPLVPEFAPRDWFHSEGLERNVLAQSLVNQRRFQRLGQNSPLGVGKAIGINFPGLARLDGDVRPAGPGSPGRCIFMKFRATSLSRMLSVNVARRSSHYAVCMRYHPETIAALRRRALAGGGFNRSMQHTTTCVSSGGVANETATEDLLLREPAKPDVGALAARTSSPYSTASVAAISSHFYRHLGTQRRARRFGVK